MKTKIVSTRETADLLAGLSSDLKAMGIEKPLDIAQLNRILEQALSNPNKDFDLKLPPTTDLDLVDLALTGNLRKASSKDNEIYLEISRSNTGLLINWKIPSNFTPTAYSLRLSKGENATLWVRYGNADPTFSSDIFVEDRNFGGTYFDLARLFMASMMEDNLGASQEWLLQRKLSDSRNPLVCLLNALNGVIAEPK